MPRILARTPVKPSEDVRKVERAVRTVFPDAVIETRGHELWARSDSLQRFRDLVWKEKILDATRRVLLGSLDESGGTARFELSKQAAFAGHVSFAVGDAPLGNLEVTVEGDDLEAVFKELAPPTLRGKPVSEEEYERHLERQRKGRAAKADASREEE